MTTTDARKRRLQDLATAAGYPSRCTELTCPHHGARNRALLEGCGHTYPDGTACALVDHTAPGLAEVHGQVNAAHNGPEASRG